MSTVGQTTKNTSTALNRQQHEDGGAAIIRQSHNQARQSGMPGVWQQDNTSQYPPPPLAAAGAKSHQDNAARKADVNQMPANVSAHRPMHFAVLSHHSGLGLPAASHWDNQQTNERTRGTTLFPNVALVY